MKQRSRWIAFLLLITGLIRSATGEQCTDDGVVGTFAQEGEVTSLTVTVANFEKDLELMVDKNLTGGELGIQIYVTLDEDSQCKETDGSFEISNPEDQVKCTFKYKWITGTSFQLTYDDTEAVKKIPSFNDPFQASFEVRDDVVIISNPVQGQVQPAKAKKCFKKDGDKLSFQLKAEVLEPKPTKQECGIQLEMKGPYVAKSLKLDDKDCTLTCPGCTNPDSSLTPPPLSSMSPASTTSSGLSSGAKIGTIVGIVLLVLIAIACVVGIVVFVVMKKRKAANAEENLEAGAPDAQQAGDETGPEAEQPNDQDAEQPGNDKPKADEEQQNKPDEA